MVPDQEIPRLPWRWLLNDVIDAPEAGLAPAGPANSTPQIFVAARYDIVTAGKNWVTVVASSGSFDRLGHAFAVIAALTVQARRERICVRYKPFGTLRV